MATTEHVKKFVFASQTSCGSTDEKVEIFIPEVGLLWRGLASIWWGLGPVDSIYK